jgi:hypothetical protein
MVPTSQSSFHQLLHNHPHLSSGACTTGQKWPQYQGLSPTPPIIIIKKKLCPKDCDLHTFSPEDEANTSVNIYHICSVISQKALSFIKTAVGTSDLKVLKGLISCLNSSPSTFKLLWAYIPHKIPLLWDMATLHIPTSSTSITQNYTL